MGHIWQPCMNTAVLISQKDFRSPSAAASMRLQTFRQMECVSQEGHVAKSEGGEVKWRVFACLVKEEEETTLK